MSNEEITDSVADAAIRALDEIFSDPKTKGPRFRLFLLVRQASGELAFEQEPLDFLIEQAVAEAFGQPKSRRRRMIRLHF